MLTYNPPPHMDAKALIVRAAARLRAWHEKYGEHQPRWLPPAGDVEWLEDAAAYIAAHTLPAPTAVVPVVVAVNPSRDQGPCTVCGVPWAKHGTAPTCASHDYTPGVMGTQSTKEK